MYEHELYHIEKEIAAYNNINLPKSLKLDFNEPEYPKTAQDQILLDEHRLRHNMINETDLLMEYNKDLTKQEAEKIIESNKEVNSGSNVQIDEVPVQIDEEEE